ncbi:MAG: CotH kinase family protein, partial [Bacteroidota bacterium]
MIVRQLNTPRSKRKLPFAIKWLWWGIALAAIGIGLSYIPRSTQTEAIDKIVRCSAEEKVLHDGKMVFQGEGGLFDNVQSQSDEAARTGEYASKITKEANYGITYNLPQAQAGDRYRASVWRQGNKLARSFLVVSIADTGEYQFYQQMGQAIEVDENEWEKLEIVFQVPDNYRQKPIKIYVYGGEMPVYFDDMEIERLTAESMALDTSLANLHLQITDAGMLHLEERRQQALNRGIYFASDDDWVKGKLIEDQDEFGVKLRFKGDWMDHLAHAKWSFRIKVKAPHAWRRMLTFSIQRPENRGFLYEWIFHQWLKKEGLLTTRYDFVNVRLNDEEKGLYAYEEHFEKQLLEYRARREGPILKFSEDGVWNARKRWLDLEAGAMEIEETLNSYEASSILPFQEGKTTQSPVLNEQFAMARSLMQQYKFGLKPTSEVFDVEQLAKFYAITDICQAFHATVWHNQRFYYNPVNSRLEPIGYDGYTEEGIYKLGKAFIGADVHRLAGDFGDDLLRQHMLDADFVERYLYYLDAFSKKTYQDNLWLDLGPRMQQKINLLRQEYPNYNYNPAVVKDQAAKIQRLMFPLNNNSLRVLKADNGRVNVKNHHILPIEVIGFGKKPDKMTDSLEQALWLMPSRRTDLPRFMELESPAEAKYLFFRLPGHAKVYYSRILPWSVTSSSIPRQEVFGEVDVRQQALWKIQGQQLLIRGSHVVEKDIIVPKGYQLVLAAGTQLDFQKGARFLSASPVRLIGSEEEPIRIYSSDKSAKGFTVLQAAGISNLKHVSFENFG